MATMFSNYRPIPTFNTIIHATTNVTIQLNPS